jgi:hypothetical protein
VQKKGRATRAKEVRLEKPAEKHPSPGHTHVGFGRRSVANQVGCWYGVFTLRRILTVSGRAGEQEAVPAKYLALAHFHLFWTTTAAMV